MKKPIQTINAFVLTLITYNNALAAPIYDPTHGCVPEDCSGADGCIGTQICLANGQLSAVCQCKKNCTTICNNWGHLNSSGDCVSPETCNHCDDDLDGTIDGPNICANTTNLSPSMPEACTNGNVGNISWIWESSQQIKTAINGGYAPQTRLPALLFASPWITQASITFNISPGGVDAADNLSLVNYQTNSFTRAKNGTNSFTLPQGAQAGYWGWQFNSNSTKNGAGFNITNIGYACGAGGTSSLPVLTEDGTQSYVLLTGTNDAVFFAFDVPEDNLSTVIWLEDDSHAPFLDADLYVDEGTAPSRASAFQALSTSNQDFIEHKFAKGRIYIAVHSKSGSGVVKVRAATRRPQARFDVSVCTEPGFDPTAGEFLKMYELLRLAQNAFWGMTEGKASVHISGYITTGSCLQCGVCFHKDAGRAYAIRVLNEANIYSDEWNTSYSGLWRGAATLSHEWGHSLLKLGDEYVDHGKWVEDGTFDGACNGMHFDEVCNASQMDDQMVSSNLCTDFDHGSEMIFGAHVASARCPGTDEANRNTQSCATGSGPNLSCSSCTGINACLPQFSSWNQIGTSGIVDRNQSPYYTPDTQRFVGHFFYLLDAP